MNLTIRRLVAIGLPIALVTAFQTAAACDRIVPITTTQLSASNTHPGNPLSYLVDGNVETAWGAGGFATQWVQVDLGSVQPVCELLLTVSQSPSGTATHVVLVGDTEQTLAPLTSIAQSYVDRQVVRVYIGANTRFIRIRTDTSPSWIAWREMQILSGQSARANNADLRYIGFFSDGGNDNQTDPTPNLSDPRLYNATAAVANSANIAWTSVWQVANKVRELQQLGRNDTKLIVVMGDIFFDPLVPYETAWLANKMDNLLASYGANMAAITIADEPDTMTLLNVADFNNKLLFLKSKIKASTYSIPVFINYSYLAFASNRWPGFEHADWVGFDCYPQHMGSSGAFRYDQCDTNAAGAYNRISDRVDALVAKTASTKQRIALFPQTFYAVTNGTQPTSGTPVPADAKDFINAAYDNLLLIAENEPKVIALFNFIYQSLYLPPHESWVGAEWLTDPLAERNIKAKTQAVGGCITGRAPCPQRRLRPVNAASSAGSSTTSNAFDGNQGTSWESGQYAPQTIWLEFPRGVGISKLRLTPNQWPTCASTVHEVWGGASVSNLSRMAIYSGNTCDGQTFELTEFWRNNDIRRLEIRTISSPSWVAWREIEVFR